ncbi:MAG: hypothetical protein IJX51_08685 [Clostridia bacterium]|nr:hypothetical protein [Clostridia bacterium]
MSYIEREALLKSLESKRLIFEESTPVDEAIAEQVSVFEETIEEAPTADVVEVCRCEICKHLEILNSRNIYAKCRMTDLEFKPFDIDTRKHYCSYGERREE